MHDDRETESGMKNDFNEMYKKYHDNLFWHVLEIIKDFDAAEDICQDVWYVFCTSTQRSDNVKAFLRGIAKNKIYQYWKKNKKDTTIIEKLMLNEETIEKNEKFEEFADSITAGIKDEHERELEKLILLMREKHGYSNIDISLRLKLTRRQVDDRIRKITKRITEYIQKNGIETIKELME